MADSSGRDASRVAERHDSDHDDKVERLLLTGLDHYLAGQHEQAINVWTRVLFLDRGHRRARAYIERARSALAERQRESDELLDNGVAALQRGETATARRLITSAVDRGGSADDALVVLERLERLETAGATARATGGRFRRLRRKRLASARRDVATPPIRWLPVALVVVLAAVVLVTAAAWDQIRPLLGQPAAPTVVAPVPTDDSVPVPRRAELAVSRAHSLLQRGHLHEALRLLQRVPPGDPLVTEAAALRATIQRTLLTGSDPGAVLDRTGGAASSGSEP